MSPLDILTEACESLLADDDFWLLAAVTDQSYEEGVRNRTFRNSVNTFAEVGADSDVLATLSRGINGNLTEILNRSPAVTQSAVQNKSRVPDILFATDASEAFVESKLLYDCAFAKQYRFKVPEDAAKLRLLVAPDRALLQVVFFVQLPGYSYPAGKWFAAGKQSPKRDGWLVYPGIASQFAMLQQHMPQPPAWPEHPARIRHLHCSAETEQLLHRWFNDVFTSDTPWEFDAQIHLKDAAVGCAVWQY